VVRCENEGSAPKQVIGEAMEGYGVDVGHKVGQPPREKSEAELPEGGVLLTPEQQIRRH